MDLTAETVIEKAKKTNLKYPRHGSTIICYL